MHRLAIVGAGPAGFGCYLECRVAGLTPEQIVVIDPHEHPFAEYVRKATIIGQDRLRSESADQFELFDTLSFAISDSLWHPQRTARNMVGATLHRYHPEVSHVSQRVRHVAMHLDWYRSRVTGTVERVERRPGCFLLFDATGRPLAEAQHLFLGLGNGIANEPAWFLDAKHALPDLVGHAYEFPALTDIPEQVQGRVVAVAGAGLTGITRVRQAIQAGAERVEWLLRRAPDFRSLNTDRKYFSRAGRLQALRIDDPDARLALIKYQYRGTFPMGVWKPFLAHNLREGRLRLNFCQPRVVQAADGAHAIVVRGDRISPRSGIALGETMVEADLLIGCLGFEKRPETLPPLGQIVRDYGIAVHQGYPMLDEYYRIAELSESDSACFLGGSYAQYVNVAGNTLRGCRQSGRAAATCIVHAGSRSPLTLGRDSLRALRLLIGRRRDAHARLAQVAWTAAARPESADSSFSS